jgi:hypothetical protein
MERNKQGEMDLNAWLQAHRARIKKLMMAPSARRGMQFALSNGKTTALTPNGRLVQIDTDGTSRRPIGEEASNTRTRRT